MNIDAVKVWAYGQNYPHDDAQIQLYRSLTEITDIDQAIADGSAQSVGDPVTLTEEAVLLAQVKYAVNENYVVKGYVFEDVQSSP